MKVFKLEGEYVVDPLENVQTLLKPVLDEADALYWVSSQQSSMVRGWFYDDNEDILDRYLVDADQFRAGLLDGGL